MRRLVPSALCFVCVGSFGLSWPYVPLSPYVGIRVLPPLWSFANPTFFFAFVLSLPIRVFFVVFLCVSQVRTSYTFGVFWPCVPYPLSTPFGRVRFLPISSMKSVATMAKAAAACGLPDAALRKVFGSRALKKTRSAKRRPAGRPRALSSRHQSQLHSVVANTQAKEGGISEISAERIYRGWKSKCCSLRTLRRWLSRHYRWMAPSTRVELKPADVAERRNFKARNGPQGLPFWKKLVYIDGHTVKKVSSLRAAAHVAKSRCRGQYRRKVNNRVMKTGLLPKCHGRISKKLRFNTGGAFKFIVARSYEKGVFFMHRVSSPGSWTATAAAEMYKGLRRAVGHDRQVTLLEDNDPVWKTASVGRVKSSLRFRTLPGGFPRRSPDLNPLDFAINAEIDRRALRSFRRNRGRRVSNKEFIEGVERIAMGNSMKAFVRKCIASMPGRVNRFDVNEVS